MSGSTSAGRVTATRRRHWCWCAALVALELLVPAIAAAGPFPETVIEPPRKHPHRTAYLCLLGGAGLIGGSFVFSDRANDAYDEYLTSTDPERLDALYDEAVRYDRLSSGSLLAGEILIAAGLYLRFLRRGNTGRMTWSVGARSCAVSYRF